MTHQWYDLSLCSVTLMRLMAVNLLLSFRNISHICSGWTWSMPSTKVWSASSFLTLWVWDSFPSARLRPVILCCSYSSVPLFFASCSPSSSPGLCWLWRGSVYMGNTHHHPRFIHHSGALGHWDQNLGEASNFRLIDGIAWWFLHIRMPPFCLVVLRFPTYISILALWEHWREGWQARGYLTPAD